MPDVSPTRWHLAHTTWLFEAFVLSDLPDYRVYHPQFNFLFNPIAIRSASSFPDRSAA
jgi:hypothetical protein